MMYAAIGLGRKGSSHVSGKRALLGPEGRQDGREDKSRAGLRLHERAGRIGMARFQKPPTSRLQVAKAAKSEEGRATSRGRDFPCVPQLGPSRRRRRTTEENRRKETSEGVRSGKASGSGKVSSLIGLATSCCRLRERPFRVGVVWLGAAQDFQICVRGLRGDGIITL